MKRSLVLLFTALALSAQVHEPRPGFNIFSREQDVQMGREAVKEIDQTRPLLHNEDLLAYLSRIGSRLARSRHAGDFPFRFHVINDKAINAFAFPGGPVYVNSGLLASIESETELAAVLAHEMSHVALRHGTHQATKSIPIAAAAAFFGAIIGDDSTTAQLAQFGINFGAQSMLLHYSRESESEADMNGVLILHDTGYDPLGMARFFERLEGQGTQPSGVAAFLSDHPSPANRVEAVDRQIRMLSTMKTHETDPRTFARVKRLAAQTPAPAGDNR